MTHEIKMNENEQYSEAYDDFSTNEIIFYLMA
jgi:hypothetical protein